MSPSSIRTALAMLWRCRGQIFCRLQPSCEYWRHKLDPVLRARLALQRGRSGFLRLHRRKSRRSSMGPNTRWKGFTLALLLDGIQTNPPRRKMLSLLNALITVEGPRSLRRTTFLQMSWRPFRRSTNKDGALSRRMRDTLPLLQACTVRPSSAALS